jgi:hypothetical protein
VGKHTDKLGSFDNFKAPWESETGSDDEIDAAKFKKYLFNLLADKAKAEDAADEAAEKVTQIQAELDTAKKDVAKGDTSGKVAELQEKLTKAESEAETAKADYVRLEVATEKGLTPKQAKRLQGKTKEELEADADEILEEFGVKKSEESQDDEDDENEGRTTPRPKLNLVNPGDSGGKGGEYDYDKIAADIVGGSNF